MPANGKAVRGRLCEATETRFEETLIPICDTIENADYLIPALTYHYSVTMSPKFKRLLPILDQVPGREGIRIHRGTHPKHSKGCILVPPHMELALTQKMLREQRSHEECRIEICNHTNLTRVWHLAHRTKATLPAALPVRNAKSRHFSMTEMHVEPACDAGLIDEERTGIECRGINIQYFNPLNLP